MVPPGSRPLPLGSLLHRAFVLPVAGSTGHSLYQSFREEDDEVNLRTT